jgi:hypothetical protein
MADPRTNPVPPCLLALAHAHLQDVLKACAELLAFAEGHGACPDNDRLNAACDSLDALSPLVLSEAERRHLKGWLASSVPLVARGERQAGAYQLRQVQRALRRALASL